MYTLTFNRDTIDDLLAHRSDGRQFYGAIIIPYSGIFSHKYIGSYVQPPKIVCPYQVNDIIAIQERWARNNSSYVYETGISSRDSGYNFRPAITMPLDAVRMYGRIVSIKPWRITQSMANHYLSKGMSTERYPGVGKVIGYADTANRLLSEIRKIHNRAVLNKSGQPLVPDNLPTVIKNVNYYLREPIDYNLYFVSDSHAWDTHPYPDERYNGPTSQMAQAYNDNLKILKCNKGGMAEITLDYYLGDWEWTVKTTHQAQDYLLEHQTKGDGKGLIKRGEYYYSPDSTESEDRQYVWIYTQDGKPKPRFRYYQTEIVDPDKHWFAWMISGYLSDKDGNTIGKWY